MKKVVIVLLVFMTYISCDKKLGDLKYIETIPGGCASSEGAIQKNSQTQDVDKVTYQIVDGNLEILVGFNATCCGEFSTSYEIMSDTIVIKIKTTKVGSCNCICYYTYNFRFTGDGSKYKYQVTVDDSLSFSGAIKP
jgi:hypothetical protein